MMALETLGLVKVKAKRIRIDISLTISEIVFSTSKIAVLGLVFETATNVTCFGNFDFMELIFSLMLILQTHKL